MDFVMEIGGVRWKFAGVETYLWQFAWHHIGGEVVPVLEECNGHNCIATREEAE